MKREKSDVISSIIDMLIDNNKISAKSKIINEYPHKIYNIENAHIQYPKKCNNL